MSIRRLPLLLLVIAACDRGSDGSPPDAAATDLASLGAEDYCEVTAAPFCAFYLRCGRMAVSTEEACRAVFLETCNERFEPRYVDLERAGLLSLSSAGIAACAAHLETVACPAQLLDLDGPCAAMWLGLQPTGGPCGIDVESFVCEPGSSCRLGLSLCGSCEPGAPQRPSLSFAYVAEGEACDRDHRCPYLTSCVAGTCQRSALLGEACGATTTCTSGRCLSGSCQPLAAEGAACDSGSACRSGYCPGGSCAPLPSACF